MYIFVKTKFEEMENGTWDGWGWGKKIFIQDTPPKKEKKEDV
jgi:hypothetical protein